MDKLIADYRKSGNLLFFSGVTGAPGNAKTQIENVLEKIMKMLQEAGSSMENVLSVLIILANLEDRPTALNPLWQKYFPKNPPARTTVQAGLGSGILVEMMVVAHLRSEP